MNPNSQNTIKNSYPLIAPAIKLLLTQSSGILNHKSLRAQSSKQDQEALSQVITRFQTWHKQQNSSAAPFERSAKHALRNHIGLIKGYLELFLEETKHIHIRKMINKALDTAEQILKNITIIEHGIEPNIRAALPSSICGKLLIVDDDPDNCKLLSRYLQQLGHSTQLAYSGEQALHLLETETVDLIFLDLIMPGMDGFETLKRLKHNEASHAIPVIMLSGVQDTEGVVRCISEGADDYLYKPFDAILLQARLNAGLERKRWHDKEARYRRELEKNQQFIRQVFGRYVSEEVVANLLENPQGLNMGGVQRKVTILMADIRGFTPLCESLPANQVVTLLNNYISPMSDIIMDYGGIVDEILGDAILAIFGAPIKHSNDSDLAVACALEMQQTMSAINRKNRDSALPEIAIGIGINTGEVVAGNIGSEKRSKYGIVGHHVNLAARIESYSQAGEILISENTFADVQSPLNITRSFKQRLKGVKDSVEIHQVKGMENLPNKSTFVDDT